MRHLYVHVPFCQEICAYCDFFRVKCHDGLIEKWLVGLEAELQQYQNHYPYIDTIYLGGGTPSSLSHRQLHRLLQLVQPFADQVTEYSFEANPESLSEDKMQLLVQYGINRISLGVQTLDDAILQRIHRQHTKADVLHVIEQLHRHGIHNITIDMMYGLPNQSMELWQHDIKEITSWPIHHVSMYSLTIEEHSEFGRENLPLIDNEIEGEMYEAGVAILEANGFHQYEVASFAKNGCVSKHNLGYWKVEDYLGVGCGAHGCLGNVRYENTENIHAYLQGDFMEKQEVISFKDRVFEMVMLGLRMKQGIDLKLFHSRFHVELTRIYPSQIKENIAKGMLEIEDGYLRTTQMGLQFLHSLLLDFMDD